jgi:hypothetical protein
VVLDLPCNGSEGVGSAIQRCPIFEQTGWDLFADVAPPGGSDLFQREQTLTAQHVIARRNQAYESCEEITWRAAACDEIL